MSEIRYRVRSVEQAAPPEGVQGGGTWCRYVIEWGERTIVGHRRGTVQQVTRHAQEFVEELNARAAGKGRSMWAPRQRGRTSG